MDDVIFGRLVTRLHESINSVRFSCYKVAEYLILSRRKNQISLIIEERRNSPDGVSQNRACCGNGRSRVRVKMSGGLRLP